MIQFEPNKNARIHWQVYALTENELNILKEIKDLEVLFNEFKYHAELDKQFFSRKKGFKMVLCHIGKRYFLTSAIKNYEGTYQGSIYISDDDKAKNDLLVCMNAISKNAGKFMGLAKDALLKGSMN